VVEIARLQLWTSNMAFCSLLTQMLLKILIVQWWDQLH